MSKSSQAEVLGTLRHALANTNSGGELLVEIQDAEGQPYHAPVRRVSHVRSGGTTRIILHIDDAYVDATPVTQETA